MNEILQRKLKELPEAPGIYQMLDKRGNIIYIGKSKCLKKRVHSYFVPSPVWEKAKEMSRFIEDIEIIVTDTHLEAMLLECEMIKKVKPHFNSMMKNDTRYSYLTLEENYRRNPLKITGSREKMSFGPFRSKGQLQDTIDDLRNLYPIKRNCGWFSFEYHIFPCEMDKETFAANREILTQIFTGRGAMSRFLYAIEQKMKEAAADERFERAAQYRNLYMRMNGIGKALGRMEEWGEKDVIYTVPLEEGYKMFYIADRRIVYCEMAAENTDAARDVFIEKVKSERDKFACAENKEDMDEKELLDYRDIVCAELAGGYETVYIFE